MSFSATLYNCSDDPRKLSKNLESGVAISTIIPTESCDILNPVFILNYNAGYATKNYIVVGAPFNRSYFITDMKIDIGKKIVINCSVDVLGTYSNEILNIQGYIVRTGHAASMNRFISDNSIPIKTETITDNFKFDKTPFNIYPRDSSIERSKRSFVLTVIGGGEGQ